MMVVDPETNRIRNANKEACAFYGYSKNEFLNLRYNDINGQIKIFLGEILKSTSKNKYFKAYSKHKKKCGTLVNVEVHIGKVNVKSAEKILVIVNKKKITDLDIYNQPKNIREYVINSSYFNEEFRDYAQKKMAQDFEILIKTQKLYTEKDLTIEQVAGMLGTNRSYLSKSINSVLGMNFRSFINELRIYEAMRLIRYNLHPNYSIEGIANIVGFIERSSFISAFKKYIGLTPSDYSKSLKNEKSKL